MGKEFKDSKNRVWIYAGCAVLLMLLTFSPPTTTTVSSRVAVPKFDTITISTYEHNATFKIIGMIETYTQDGEKMYAVTFKDKESKLRLNCEIPGEYSEYLSKDTEYKGTVHLSYLDELLTYNQYNNATLLFNGFEQGIEVLSIEFMFSEFIISEFKSESSINEQFIQVYGSEKYIELNMDKGDGSGSEDIEDN